VVDVEQHAKLVRVVFEDVSTGQLNSVEAEYVVGCDGAGSTTRHYLQTELEDLGFKERWLVVDVLLKRDMPELGDFTVQYCDHKQPMTYCRNPGHRRRWEMALPDSITDDNALSQARIWSLLSRWICPEDVQIERKAIYTFRSALSRRWRNNRLLIAGDAAHLTAPFMGQGMCAGIRDAANLAWKLAACVKKSASDKLLDSYAQERIPHARAYIETAIKLGKLMKSIDQIDRSDKPTTANQVSPPTMASIAPALGLSHFQSQWPTPSQYRGKLFAQPRLSTGQLLDDVVGYRFALLTRNNQNQTSENFHNPHKLFYLSGSEHPEIANVLEELKLKAALIRPDRYILATAETDEEVKLLQSNLSDRIAF